MILLTTIDIWRTFCRHVIDIGNDYFDKDRLLVDSMENMLIEVGGSADDDTNDNDDDDDDVDIDLLVDDRQENY